MTLRLILMGTGPFAVPSFEALRKAGHDIACVVTKPQPPVKSRKGPPPNPVRAWAHAADLSVFDPATINEPDAIAKVASEGADLLVVCDYGHILKPEALETARLGGINLHGSLLPKFRGAAPVQRALLEGEAITGVSVIHMTPRLDGGPILTTRETEIRDDETSGQLEERLSEIGVDATLEAVEMLKNWDGQTVIGQKQDPAGVTKAPRLSKAEGEIDWSWTSREIHRHVRGMQPWPGAFTHLDLANGKPPIRLAVRSVESSTVDCSEFDPGEIVSASRIPGESETLSDEGMHVATSDCFVTIKRLQPAGKKEMPANDFLRGHQPKSNARLA